jgi:hypothetical protein
MAAVEDIGLLGLGGTSGWSLALQNLMKDLVPTIAAKLNATPAITSIRVCLAW